jgi:hypothetical protein
LTFIGLIVCGAIYDPDMVSGTPKRLNHATDYLGNICGKSKKTSDLPMGYYLPNTAGAFPFRPVNTSYLRSPSLLFSSV